MLDMEQELKQNLLNAAEELSSLTGTSEQSISQRAINDNTFFVRLRDTEREKPIGFTVRTYDRLMDWMEREKRKAVSSALASAPSKEGQAA